jgi:hypothetical protein
MNDFYHDSELPTELCADPSCEDHHPECAWNLADASTCSGRGINRIAGRAWCSVHTAELEKQIAGLKLHADTA